MTMTEGLETLRLSLPIKGAGEWDWFYALNFGDQMSLRRCMVKDGLGPDELATHLGTDIDDACSRWRNTILVGRMGAELENEFDETVIVTAVVGAQEACELFGWRLATFHQWNFRKILPAPDMIVNGAPAWWTQTLETWATITGRL